MKTLTVDEAVASLDQWLELALAGEEIQIRKGEALVELRPAPPARPAPATDLLAAREALRRLQQEARLTPADAESYLHEVREDRLAAEDRRLA
jgi:antitoxin (DNA-binding transcriptional repressor) of toxin-antitoxin stability system